MEECISKPRSLGGANSVDAVSFDSKTVSSGVLISPPHCWSGVDALLFGDLPGPKMFTFAPGMRVTAVTPSVGVELN